MSQRLGFAKPHEDPHPSFLECACPIFFLYVHLTLKDKGLKCASAYYPLPTNTQ